MKREKRTRQNRQVGLVKVSRGDGLPMKSRGSGSCHGDNLADMTELGSGSAGASRRASAPHSNDELVGGKVHTCTYTSSTKQNKKIKDSLLD